MTDITVFYILVVASALVKTAALVEGYDISRVPKSYDEWIGRYRSDPALQSSMEDLSIEEPVPTLHFACSVCSRAKYIASPNP